MSAPSPGSSVFFPSWAPPSWWVAGYGTVGLGVAVAEHRRARRCRRQRALARTLFVLIAVAAASWLATRYVVVPATDWLTGPDPPPSDGPILP